MPRNMSNGMKEGNCWVCMCANKMDRDWGKMGDAFASLMIISMRLSYERTRSLTRSSVPTKPMQISLNICNVMFNFYFSRDNFHISLPHSHSLCVFSSLKSLKANIIKYMPMLYDSTVQSESVRFPHLLCINIAKVHVIINAIKKNLNMC